MSKEAMKRALENSMPSFMSPEWTLVRNEDIAALREALAEPDFWEGYVPEPDKRQQALDKKAENARELGLDYEPVQCPVCKAEDSPYPKCGCVIYVDEQRAWFTIDELNAWADKKLKENPQWAEQPAHRDIRNATLDEIADKIGKMPFGDTAASFAVWIREQKT